MSQWFSEQPEEADARAGRREQAEQPSPDRGAGSVAPAPPQMTVAIVSGGNLDANLLARLINRRETRVRRRLPLYTRVPDRPDGLAQLLNTVAPAGANVIELAHARDDANLPLAQTGVELLLELRSDGHADALAQRLSAAGYPSRSRDESAG